MTLVPIAVNMVTDLAWTFVLGLVYTVTRRRHREHVER